MIIKDRVLIAEEGKVLFNGESYASIVYLGKYDSIENWQEVDIEEDTEDNEV